MELHNLDELFVYLQSPEAYQGEFYYRNIPIWWSDRNIPLIMPSPDSGYFRCDPTTDWEYEIFNDLSEHSAFGFDWVLS